ncbi:hypothetical protein [Streptomyces sp. uw30]|uniref:hypothetical protein n=1 Tax=Streptomyces sp. uw30 TaxID=1828179 RepID=UPI001C9D49D1|nr:hypothetical protein [Streptomyces sp. uw30]
MSAGVLLRPLQGTVQGSRVRSGPGAAAAGGQRAPRRRLRRVAVGAALLLVAETALVAGATVSTSTASASGPAKVQPSQPSQTDIFEADMAWAAKRAKGSKAWAIVEAKRTKKKVVVCR